MAVDALEYDESAEDANPAGALEEILENPERLKDLDLDAFAEELERQVRPCLCVLVLAWTLAVHVVAKAKFQSSLKKSEENNSLFVE